MIYDYGGWGRGLGEGIVRELHLDTNISTRFIKELSFINKDLLYSTWNSAQCSVTAWMEVEFGAEWIHAYVWLSPFTITTLLTATSQYKIKG